METEKTEVVSNENRDFLEVLMDDVLHKVMGRALDLARISEMSDRSLNQFSRNLKDHTNDLVTYSIKVLKEKGYIHEEKN